jgi:hypothetical protein
MVLLYTIRSSKEGTLYVLFKKKFGAVTRIFITLMIVGVASGAVPQMYTLQPSTSNSNESTQAKIARALSAALPDVGKAATVVEKDPQGKMRVLRAAALSANSHILSFLISTTSAR